MTKELKEVSDVAELKMPKYVYKDKPISLDDCYRHLSEMSYQSPIEIIQKQIRTEFENNVYKAIQDYGVVVDKDELIKALQYDRGQYEKGFIDGCNVIKTKLASEIFEDIGECASDFAAGCIDDNEFLQRIYDLRKKYTEGEK